MCVCINACLRPRASVNEVTKKKFNPMCNVGIRRETKKRLRKNIGKNIRGTINDCESKQVMRLKNGHNKQGS